MNSHTIIFSINDTIKMVTELKDPLEYIGWDHHIPIKFLYRGKLINVADGPIYFNIRDLRDKLDHALNNKLIIDKSIKQDFGFLYNQFIKYSSLYYKNRTGFMSNSKLAELWTGYQTYVWEAYENEKRYTTWLYNDYKSNILFTITPTYAYNRTTKRNMYVPYKKWILQYKPYYTAILPRETAQEWYNLANMIVTIIDKNIKEWEKRQ